MDDKHLNEEQVEKTPETEQPEIPNTRLPDPPEWNYERPEFTKQKKPKTIDHRGVGEGLAASYLLVGSVLLGLFIGWLIDREGTMGLAIGGFIGSILGIFGAIWIIIKGEKK